MESLVFTCLRFVGANDRFESFGEFLRGCGLVVKPEVGWGAYAASKAALECISYILACELREFGMRVHLYDPGDKDTELHRRALPEDNLEELLKPEHSVRPILYLTFGCCDGPERQKPQCL